VVHVEVINAYNVLVGLPEGKRTLRRHRRKWRDNIKVDVKWDGRLAHVIMIINLRVPRKAGSVLAQRLSASQEGLFSMELSS
jgi:hypothetical protein